MKKSLNKYNKTKMKRLCPRKEILIVDDDEVSRYYVESIIHKESTLGTVSASNGKEAYEIVEECKPSLIITDLLMFHMNGFEFVAKLKSVEEYKNIPIIIMTCLDDDEIRKNIKTLQIDAFIRKPYTPETLLDIVNKILKK